ncbi:MAG: rane protein [Sphingobacteriaceae bacterium]|jgi:TonB-linked SusC/RagA family outer membrane protein|nr:rane protein [Sphingobacteriaceae bacterium]
MKKALLILCNLLICFSVIAQTQTVTGVVTSSGDGTTVPGATITVKGTSRGVATDARGSYSISNVPSNATLIISAIGYENTEISVSGRQVINVALKENLQQLNEVMVVAYGTANKQSYTGSATVVNQSEIKDPPNTSFESALSGKVPGLQVTSSSGQAGSTPSIRIRGIGSMSASNEPLYVIDGVPVVSGNAGQLSDYTFATNNIMSTLNPADIESITVLKDAAASSLYGSRAANGVILITTKRGKQGKPTINFKSSIGFTPSWATDNYEPAGVQEQINMLYSILYDSRITSGRTPAQANEQTLMRLNSRNWSPGSSYGNPTTSYGFGMHGYQFSTTGISSNENVIIKGKTDGVENRDGKFFDWEDALFETGQYQTNDLSVSGGDENTTYYSSFSYTKDQSRIKLNDFDRISGRINLSQKVGKAVEFISNVNVARSGQSGYNDTRNNSSNYFMQSRNLLWPFYWPTDYKTGQPYTARFGSLAQNNVYYDNEWENSSITRRITANETVNIKFLPELNLRSIFSYDNAQIKDHIYYSALHFNAAATNGAVNDMTTNNNKLVSSTTLNYNKSFGLHNLGLLVGFEAEKNMTDFERSSGTDLPSSSLHTVATAGVQTANAYEFGNSILSGLSRAEYNYNKKYFLSASYRRDGSSKLGPETRWGDFWSVGGAWNISNETFMDNMDYISNLRLRASYGTNGTLPINNFGWRSLTSYTSKYNGKAGGTISTIVDPNLTWETSYSSNIGLEFGLLDQRINGTIEYFNRDSKDLLQDVPISMVTGFGSTLKNVGEINNHGLEISLGGDIIRNKNVRWSASINTALIKTNVTKLYKTEGQANGQDIIWYDPTGSDSRAQFIYREGQPTLSFYGYEWGGVDPTNGRNVWFVNDPQSSTAGDFQLDGRGATYNYSKANYTIIGNATPKAYGGLNTDVEFKGISLGLNFNYKIGGDLYDGAYKDVADDGYYWERIRSEDSYENMWTAQNPTGTLPRLEGTDLTDPQQYSSRQLHSASFLRLKQITLGYNIPKSVIGHIGVSNARLYLNGTNLLTFSKYKIADPEVNQYGTRGWETPFGKTYTMGIEIGF